MNPIYPSKTIDGGLLISVDSDLGKEVGFTSDKFKPVSYLSFAPGKSDTIYISCIEACTPGQGHFTELVNNLRARGWTIKVPNPLPGMVKVCQKMGFFQREEWAKPLGEFVEVWILKGQKTLEEYK